ncbi:hypothetical protein K435DRAFT_968182 [Dendrothele bispora CBS 962.96]|uniref:C2H2-type domain-containing protein n=1 Tax=Dendrothele bispora (strain CBS 962.96) TaxID=1314807 RepID=A0A4V4HEK3_DENBC|nr:hypothetical protein K435DRAFT_968182 [Dendrothele bispora CBS 962.96]
MEPPNHFRSDTGSKRICRRDSDGLFTCLVCGLRLRSGMSRHIKIHSPVENLANKILQCTQCDYRTDDPGSLTKHKKSSHGYKTRPRQQPIRPPPPPPQSTLSSSPSSPTSRLSLSSSSSNSRGSHTSRRAEPSKPLVYTFINFNIPYTDYHDSWQYSPPASGSDSTTSHGSGLGSEDPNSTEHGFTWVAPVVGPPSLMATAMPQTPSFNACKSIDSTATTPELTTPPRPSSSWPMDHTDREYMSSSSDSSPLSIASLLNNENDTYPGRGSYLDLHYEERGANSIRYQHYHSASYSPYGPTFTGKFRMEISHHSSSHHHPSGVRNRSTNYSSDQQILPPIRTLYGVSQHLPNSKY